MPRKRKCKTCGTWFTPTRADAVTCSSKCRQQGYRQRKAMAELFPKGSPACDIDWENHRENDSESDAVMRARAADFQLHEAERLALEFALRRRGTQPIEITAGRLARARRVMRAWRELVRELRSRRAPVHK
jgi:hypothetical protein